MLKRLTIAILLMLAGYTAKAQVLVSDSLALVALYNSTNGPGWTDNTNWLTGPVSTWHGVTLAGNRVTELQLSYKQLNGSIPPELGNLSALRNLRLPYNELTGSIPPELGNLSALEYLGLEWGQLTGSIPPEFGNLSALTYLSLRNNQLTGTIPSELGNLLALTRLELQGNQLTGSIPPELGNLLTLSVLNLAGNQLSGSIPSELGNLLVLTDLSLQVNQLTGTIPQELGNLSLLEHLGLEWNQLTGSIPSVLGDLVLLTALHLGTNQLSGSIPSKLGDLLALKSFSLENNQLTGTIPPEFGNLSALEYLGLARNQLTGSIPPELGSLSMLGGLHLNNNQLTGSIPPELGNLSVIMSLDLSQNRLSGSVPVSFTSLPVIWLSIQNNLISGMPDLSSLAMLYYLDVSINNLEFDDLEPNMSVFNFSYHTQAIIPGGGTQILNVRDEFTASFTVGGSANVYQWRKDGMDIGGADSDTFTIPSVTAADAGTYVLYSTNTLVPNLTLQTEPVVLVVNAPELQISIALTDHPDGSTVIYPDTNVGDQASYSFELTNIGNAPINFGTITTTGDYHIQGVLPTTLAVGVSVIIEVIFSPTASGTRTGTLTFNSNATIPNFVLNLTGVGLEAVLNVTENSITQANGATVNYPSTNVGDQSTKSFVLTNTGNAAINFSSIVATGDYHIQGTPPTTLAAGANTILIVDFIPTVSGTRTGTLSINSNATIPNFVLNLTGVGLEAVLTVIENSITQSNGSTINYPSTNVGDQSTKSFVLTNTGNAAINFSSISITGDYQIQGTPPTTLAAGANTTLNVAFIPTAGGVRTGLLTIRSNASVPEFTLTLTGEGNHPLIIVLEDGNNKANGSTAIYELTQVGDETLKEFVISNTGIGTLTISNIDVTGDFYLAGSVPASLTSGTNAAIEVRFAPTNFGQATGRLTIYNNTQTPQFIIILRGSAEARLEIFNIVTMNKNGKHDFFHIKNIELYPQNRVMIFDRWGGSVFEVSGYDNAQRVFDGISKNGQWLPSGAYFYSIDKGDGSKKINGYLEVRN